MDTGCRVVTMTLTLRFEVGRYIEREKTKNESDIQLFNHHVNFK